MSKNFLLLCLVLCALVLIGCAKSESTTNREAAPPASPKASPAATTTTTASSTAGDKIGVPECDAYIAAYEACVRDKVPATGRAGLESSLATARKAWHDAAANPQTKAGLPAACKAATDAAKTSMKSFNCTF
jgi:hypothetical protein